MKNITVIFFLLFTTCSFAQQPTNSTLNYKNSSDGVMGLNNIKLGLNMERFKLEDFKQIAPSLSEIKRKIRNQRPTSLHKMPIFVPDGNLFLEIYDINENIDYKLRIFDLEKSKYFLRSMG